MHILTLGTRVKRSWLDKADFNKCNTVEGTNLISGFGYTFEPLYLYVSYCLHLPLSTFLCRLRSMATHRDHFVRRPSVCPFVSLSKAMFCRRHMHSSECCHYFLKSTLPLCECLTDVPSMILFIWLFLLGEILVIFTGVNFVNFLLG